MIALIALGVYFAALGFDYADARNKLAVQRRDAHTAGRWSVVMYLLGLVGTAPILHTSSVWLVLPACAGLYTGSWLAVRKPRLATVVK